MELSVFKSYAIGMERIEYILLLCSIKFGRPKVSESMSSCVRVHMA